MNFSSLIFMLLGHIHDSSQRETLPKNFFLSYICRSKDTDESSSEIYILLFLSEFDKKSVAYKS
jgi:hypothetical protein